MSHSMSRAAATPGVRLFDGWSDQRIGNQSFIKKYFLAPDGNSSLCLLRTELA
jgi:hypothetical protein